MFIHQHNLYLTFWLPVVVICLLCATTGSIRASEILAGPVGARLERVIDGDTIAVKAQIWIGQEVRVLVRVNGIDTPELKGKCVHERRLAQFARRYVIDWAGSHDLKLTNIRRGKYAGRVIADVFNDRGHKLAADLLQAGLGIVYFGGKRSNWCAQARLTANVR